MKKYTRYISNMGWLYIVVILGAVYFPVRAIIFWGWGV
jgi:hypothetical protein|tara:strand:- start:276 stop:389 length:114 start_codon:yes stop_codon:yes gene_type:complete